MEYKEVGETFEYDGKVYVVVEDSGCSGCVFEDNHPTCHAMKCSSFERGDGYNVKFIEKTNNKISGKEMN